MYNWLKGATSEDGYLLSTINTHTKVSQGQSRLYFRWHSFLGQQLWHIFIQTTLCRWLNSLAIREAATVNTAQSSWQFTRAGSEGKGQFIKSRRHLESTLNAACQYLFWSEKCLGNTLALAPSAAPAGPCEIRRQLYENSCERRTCYSSQIHNNRNPILTLMKI